MTPEGTPRASARNSSVIVDTPMVIGSSRYDMIQPHTEHTKGLKQKPIEVILPGCPFELRQVSHKLTDAELENLNIVFENIASHEEISNHHARPFRNVEDMIGVVKSHGEFQGIFLLYHEQKPIGMMRYVDHIPEVAATELTHMGVDPDWQGRKLPGQLHSTGTYFHRMAIKGLMENETPHGFERGTIYWWVTQGPKDWEHVIALSEKKIKATQASLRWTTRVPRNDRNFEEAQAYLKANPRLKQIERILNNNNRHSVLLPAHEFYIDRLQYIQNILPQLESSSAFLQSE